MADEADLANDQADRWLDQALAQAANNTSRLAPKGKCHYCEHEFDPADPLTERKLFCDADCSSDFEKEQRLKKLR